MTWVFFINVVANVVLLIGLGALLMVFRRTRGKRSLKQDDRLVRAAYWCFLIGASTEVAIAAVLFAGSLDRDGSKASWTSSQYFGAALVGVMVGWALRRSGCTRVPPLRGDQEASVTAGSSHTRD